MTERRECLTCPYLRAFKDKAGTGELLCGNERNALTAPSGRRDMMPVPSSQHVCEHWTPKVKNL